MKKILLAAVAIGFLSWLGFRLYQELESGSVEATDFPRRATLLVGTAEAEPSSFENELELLGELKPKAEVEVMSRISGRLQTVQVDRGQIVRKGELLAVVEDDQIQKQIQRGEAALAVARAGVKRAEAILENLRVLLKRNRKLHAEGLISMQELEDLESRLRIGEADVELARATVTQAQASLSELRIQQENTRIFSPLDGVVGVRHLDPGALVSPAVPIVSILRLERVKTIVPVVESVLRKIRVGLVARIVVDAYPDRTYRGIVTRISPLLDPETRSADIEIETDNPGMSLKPGMFARVKIDVSVTRSALSIPRAGLIMRGSQQGVYMLSEQKTIVFHPIQVGVIDGDVVEVLEGLEQGAVVVTTGAQSLNEGDRVRIE